MTRSRPEAPVPAADPAAVRAWLLARAAELDGEPGAPQRALREGPLGGLLGLPRGNEREPDATLPRAAVLLRAAGGGSMAAAFALWSHWVVGYYLRHGDDHAAAFQAVGDVAARLAELDRGDRFGSTGMANALKHLLGLEPLRLQAQPLAGGGWRLDGGIPWASNLHGPFLLVVAARTPQGAAVFALPGETPGLEVRAVRGLLALDGIAAGRLDFRGVEVGPEARLHASLATFLHRVRTPFTLLQAAFVAGLVDAALEAAAARLTAIAGGAAGLSRDRAGLLPRLHALQAEEAEAWTRLRAHAEAAACGAAPHAAPHAGGPERNGRRLLALRLRLGELALHATQLELEAHGGGGYLTASPTARRLREALFLPVQSPSFAQLRLEAASASAGEAA